MWLVISAFAALTSTPTPDSYQQLPNAQPPASPAPAPPVPRVIV
ncbi:MAG: hypothetical protein ACPHOL_05950 [Candidatus Puniceispirillum sp.]